MQHIIFCLLVLVSFLPLRYNVLADEAELAYCTRKMQSSRKDGWSVICPVDAAFWDLKGSNILC
jgi:hypothetical protein